MNEFDAYAPPEADVFDAAPKKRGKKKKAASGAIAEAIARLNEHLADANAVAHDRQETGGQLRRATMGFIVATVLAIAATAFFFTTKAPSRYWEPGEIGLAVFTGFLTFITLLLVIVDIRFPLRDKPVAPEETLKYFLRAVVMGRFGYAWATLCPTARDQTVEPPQLTIAVGEGSFTLRSPKDLKDYTQTFARPGNSQMRTMQIKRAALIREDGDVATVEVEATFTSWPQWAQIVSIVAFVIVRALGALLYLILFFSLRKTHNVIFQKTLIRGSNGVWYIYSGDLLEGGPHSNESNRGS